MIYACRTPRLAMNACMLQYQNQDELDAAIGRALGGCRSVYYWKEYTAGESNTAQRTAGAAGSRSVLQERAREVCA